MSFLVGFDWFYVVLFQGSWPYEEMPKLLWSVWARNNWAALPYELFQDRSPIIMKHLHRPTCLAKISSFVFTQQAKILL